MSCGDRGHVMVGEANEGGEEDCVYVCVQTSSRREYGTLVALRFCPSTVPPRCPDYPPSRSP